ncbi:DAK2 domain-containing protein [Tissierella creatinophila]|uniref:DAK2 domain protein n=1 Tax=Tissierella creatinophila DSM 6911 TaxID=1123403 RepID=A0A1U7M396_TISCR|nr:DAK2 domain-containing protein [Tissierella creatinophila]OLS01720.1 DAK2 domain protein [Tissierella creatinophila DSM 6911]
MKIKIIDGALMKKALKGAAGLLEKNKEEVNSLNVFPVPDGDTGTNMSLTIKSAVKQGLLVEGNDASKIALGASQGSLMGARGNSGVILSQLFRGFANGLKNHKEVNVKLLAKGLKEASDTAYKAVMKPTEGTILTVARECGEFAMSIWREDEDVLVFLKRVIDHGNITLEKTPEMLQVLKQAGVVDAGGKGFMYVLIGAYNALAGIESFEEEFIEKSKAPKVEISHREPIDTDDIKYGYCTELMINTKYNDINGLREDLSKLGDSLMVVGGENLIKIHIHTNDPGLVIQKGTSLGSLSDIKIDNMRYQHEEILLKKELESQKDIKDLSEKQKQKEYSFVAISIGEGIDKVFNELNVDYIVPGGQTMNPSTEDIFNAIENTKGKNVFILPNNGNIILAAEQTKELSNRNIVVLPTKTIPEGISALLAFNEEDNVEDNIENMISSIKNVVTGQITYAVRDTDLDNKRINKDDIIGLSKGDVLVSGKDINEVSINLIKEIINDDISLVTVFYGEDIKEEEANELASSLETELEGIDIEVIYGGQPLYYYIFSLE